MRTTLLSSSLLVLVACGPELVSESPRCLQLSEPEGSVGLVTAQPSRISLLFRVDTCGGEPVAGLDATAFELQEDGHTVSRFESQQRVTSQGQQFRFDSMVLLDLSGSVLKSGDFEALSGAAARYISAVLAAGNGSHRIALSTFDGRAQPQLVVDFTTSASALLAGLRGLSTVECSTSSQCAGYADRRTCAGWRCVDDSTNLYGAVTSTLELLEARLTQTDVPWRDAALVLFTDGTDQAGRVPAKVALDRAKLTKVHLFSVGLGSEVDADVLAALGREGSFSLARADQLATAFETVASRIDSLANRFYLLEYCSPRRSGRHMLKLIATANTVQGPVVGGLSREFDATGFTSGCDLSR
jgi:hypothetical protein